MTYPPDITVNETLQLHALWRKGDPAGKWADLRYANLGGANLHGANLGGANLHGANLLYADLGDANLREANLRDAYLRGADLVGANLRYANLGGANLHGANLLYADLGDADLRCANLREANLRGVTFGRATGVIVFGPLGSSGRICYAIDHSDRIMMQAGCWWGTLDDLASRIAPDGNHGWEDDAEWWRAEYTAAIAFVRTLAASKGWGR